MAAPTDPIRTIAKSFCIFAEWRMIKWDDLRYVLAVARAGSALGAARALKVDQTTVSRRLAQIDAVIGATLFETRQKGQFLTPLGQSVVASAEQMEREVLALESAIIAQQRTLAGVVRFTSSELLANYTIAPFLRTFRKQNPGIVIELNADDRMFDVGRGEADVAIRAGVPPEGRGVVARRLPNGAWATYCSKHYANGHGRAAELEDLNSHTLVGFDGPMAQIPAALWLDRQAPDAIFGTRSNSLTNHLSAVKAGLGIGVLPCFVGDADVDLVRCSALIEEAEAEMWLIVRDEIKKAPHVRVFVDSLTAHILSLRRLFAGSPSRVKTADAQR